MTITPSATNPTLADNGWKTFFRALGNDATQGPAAAKYIKDTRQVDQDVRHRRRLRVRQGPGRHRPQGPRCPGRRQRHASSRSRPTSAPSVTKVKASGADALFFGGYYPEAAPLIKQLRDAGWKGTFVVADGVKDQSFIDNAGSAAEGTIITCPCAPPNVAPEFAAAYKKAYNSDPDTYSGEGYDSAPDPARRHRRRQGPRQHGRLREDLRQEGRHQAAEVRRQG